MTSHELYVFLGRPRTDVLAPKRSRHQVWELVRRARLAPPPVSATHLALVALSASPPLCPGVMDLTLRLRVRFVPVHFRALRAIDAMRLLCCAARAAAVSGMKL